jgi:hypothetical protein
LAMHARLNCLKNFSGFAFPAPSWNDNHVDCLLVLFRLFLSGYKYDPL